MPLTLSPPRRRLWVCVAIALAVVALTAAAGVLRPATSAAQFYPAFDLLVVVASTLLGQRAGYLAVGAIGLLLAYCLLDGPGLAVANPWDALGLALFLGSGVATVAMICALRQMGIDAKSTAALAQAAAQTSSTLLSELSHRLINDFNALIMIATLKGKAAAEPETKEALVDLSERIRVMARIYGLLNLRDVAQEIDAQHFLNALCSDFQRAHLTLRPIALRVDIDAARIELGRAVLAGLILNEVLTNAVKYAFPRDQEGAISVRFVVPPGDDGAITLRVEDDGDGFDHGQPKGMGFGQKLVGAMASQLNGRFSLKRDGRLTIALLEFPAQNSRRGGGQGETAAAPSPR
jgi:two-component sensor histidine kinase